MGIFNVFKKKEQGLNLPPPPPITESMMEEAKPEESTNDFDIPAPPGEEASEEESYPEPMPAFPELPRLEPVEQKKPAFEMIKSEAAVVNPLAQPMQETKEPPRQMINLEKRDLKRESEEKHFLNAPIFVRTDKYRDILGSINTVNSKISECDMLIENLNQIKNTKDKEFGKWSVSLEEMQRKLLVIEKSLSEVSK